MNNISSGFINYYDLLGVDSGAGQEEIRQAYREKLKEWHPDKNPGRKEEAEEITKSLNIAYGILSKPESRKNYDRMLRFSRGKDFYEFVNDESFIRKVRKTSGGFKRIINDVVDLYRLFKDSAGGKYKIHPVNLGIIGAGLLYFIIPTDLIPDVIPVIGLIDDIAILTTIINSLQGELTKYRNWKQETKQELGSKKGA